MVRGERSFKFTEIVNVFALASIGILRSLTDENTDFVPILVISWCHRFREPSKTGASPNQRVDLDTIIGTLGFEMECSDDVSLSHIEAYNSMFLKTVVESENYMFAYLCTAMQHSRSG
jgi:hypothetical protein